MAEVSQSFGSPRNGIRILLVVAAVMLFGVVASASVVGAARETPTAGR